MLRQGLQRGARRLQGALARLASTSAAAETQPAAIPAEVAQLVSLRGGLTALPATIEAAVDQVAAGANRKAVKRRGQELAYRLRHMARSKHRGGQHPNLSEQLAAEEAGWDGSAAAAQRQRRGKRRQSRSAALEQLTRAAALPVGDAARLPNLDAVLGGDLHSVVAAEEAAQAAAEREATAARSSIAQGGTLYDMPAALAYAASRMPACYAALSRVLGEVAGRRPGWQPSSMLDFGSGPGTAVWAAQQVWRQAPLDALAVEPAGAMSWLGHEIQQAAAARYSEAVAAAAERAAGSGADAQGSPARGGSSSGGAAAGAAASQEGQASEDEEEEAAAELPAPPPRLRWMYKLPPQYRGAQGKRYELVTAGYVLGELRNDAERRRLVQQLWERTSGVLVLVEPGTPAGSAHIQRARTQLLETAALEQATAAGQGQPASGGSSVGAHVVAPCPHDGACPMEGRPSWCHFVQRFQRTQLQRAAKATAGVQPRTYQDERFAYVAIARGPRPAAHTPQQQPLVAGSFMPSLEDPQDSLHMPENLRARKVPADARALIAYSDSEAEEEEGEGSDIEDWWGEADAAGHSEGGYVQDSSSLSTLSGSTSSSDSSSESSSSEDEEHPAFSSSDSEDEGLLAAAAGGSSSGAEVPAGLEGLDEATRQLLLESILAGDDEDEEGGRDMAAIEAALQEAAAAAAAQQRQAGAAAAGEQEGPGRPIVVLAPVSEATADLLFDGEAVDWEAAEPAAVEAAREASGGWSRVIRSPRKRSGHVVLDICSALPAEPDGEAAVAAADGAAGGGLPQRGVLLQQVVSRAAARRQAGGTAPYRMARRLRWGDLWPAHYQRSFRATEPTAGGGLD
ncbi:methyltransferase mitochondrial [Chlorella sorokiniana]|uniref:Methyltransferase mitochondrial n=1 Tax=Chlorella sorokiniana TaxID=3076 RepID=A0A2P6TFL4_CHLSO|nr:methyltransferase mitochondrial [Chlorella sorokiniana]|eukprot:PRW32889.1 methyltransferase mitochondrial [Chlorella sorokiniana]